MRLFVVGLGAIGRRHLATARALGHEAVGGRLDDAETFRPDAIVIASPTSAHLEALAWAVERGIHAYVEKPLAAGTGGVEEVLASAGEAGLTVAVGYNLRFHPALESVRAAIESGGVGRLLSVRAEVGQYLPDWHPEEDFRRSYAARRELGGGALLTLSHELDYVRWIAGEVEESVGFASHVSSLELDVEEIVELVLTHAGGALSSVHQDLVDREYNRRSRWVGSTGTISWEWGEPVRLVPGEVVLWQDPGFDLSATYAAALADFVGAIERGTAPRCDGLEGLRVLEVCESTVILGESKRG